MDANTGRIYPVESEALMDVFASKLEDGDVEVRASDFPSDRLTGLEEELKQAVYDGAPIAVVSGEVAQKMRLGERELERRRRRNRAAKRARKRNR